MNPLVAEHVQHWENRYTTGDTPWDSQLVSRELRDFLDFGGILPCDAIDLGCGTGTNAVELARRGFQTVGLDCSVTALKVARSKAIEAGVDCEFQQIDLADTTVPLPKCDFLFDRGCYHCLRRRDPETAIRVLSQVTRPRATVLLLTGNAAEKTEPGPPVLTETELRTELQSEFELVRLREFHFEDRGGIEGPLGWSSLWRKR